MCLTGKTINLRPIAKGGVLPESKGAEESRQQTTSGGQEGNSAQGTAALKRSIGRGTLWQFAGAGWQMLIQLGASAVLARALSVRDFGVMGMAILFQGLIARLGHLGTGTGIIAKKDLTQEDLSAAFWMGFVVHGALFFILLAVAPLAELFFDKESEGVTQVLYVVAFTFLLTAVASVQGTILLKQLRFGLLKIIEGAGILIQSATAIVLAVVFDLGYWALVGGLLLSNLATTVIKIAVVRWRPSLRVSRKSFRYMFRFGIHGLGASMVQYFQHNVDYILVGKLLGTSMLGVYGFAYRIPFILLNRLALPVGHVLFPHLATVQASDERLASAFIKSAKYLALITLPLLAGLACLARPTIVVLWSSKWLPAAVPMQILCLGASIRCILISYGTIFFCKNRPDLPFKFGIVEMFLTAGFVTVFGYAYGINGVALGMVMGALLQLVVVYYALHMVHSSLGRLWKALRPVVISTLGCVVMTLGARATCESFGLPSWVVLLAAVPAGALGYMGVMAVCFPQELVEAREIIRMTFGGRGSSITKPRSE